MNDETRFAIYAEKQTANGVNLVAVKAMGLWNFRSQVAAEYAMQKLVTAGRLGLSVGVAE